MTFIKPRIHALSWSRINTHSKCAKLAYYKFVEKIKDPGGFASDRGSNIHKMAEEYLMAGEEHPLPPVLSKVGSVLYELRGLENKTVERQLSWDKNWDECEWFYPGTYMRAIMDFTGELSPTRMRIVDHKTGKVYPDHPEQLELMVLCAMHLAEWDHIDEFVVNDLYIDQGFMSSDTMYVREQFKELHDKWDPIFEKVTSDDIFGANPGSACKWCFVSAKKGGPCEHGH